MIEAHEKMMKFFEGNINLLPREMVVIIVSLDKRDNTVAASMKGDLDKANALIGLDVITNHLKKN